MDPRIGFARNMARKYLKKYRVTEPPVAVEAIIRAEAIVLEAVSYPDGTAGESWWEHGAGFIAVSRLLRPNRRRFTLAHEFGHLAMRHHDARLRDLSFLEKRLVEPEDEIWEPSDPIEVEANQFAAELLMPLALFKRDWQTSKDVPALAKRYQVSEAAAWWRVRGFPLQ